MELKECITCGSHSFTENKCDYCGNKYEFKREILKKDLVKPEVVEISFNHGNKRGDKVLSFMLYLLLSIIWFAVTVFIPPLFIITIILLVIYGAYRLTIKKK